jgi:hypothetical protein
MRWHAESWRKLYLAKSPAWLRLPVSARGLGRELLTYCDDEGRIDVGDDPPGETIAYLMGARPKEHKRIAEDVDALIADGYLVLDGQTLAIRNFAEAQDRTPAAKRTAEWRSRKDQAIGQTRAQRRVTCDVTRDVSRMSPGDAQVTSPGDVLVTTIRSEPNRVDRDPPVVPHEVEPLVLFPNEPKAPTAVDRVWSVYESAGLAAGRRRDQLPERTAKRDALIQARIDEAGEAKVANAGRGVWVDPWAKPGGTCGNASGKCTPEFAFRNVERVEAYAGSWEDYGSDVQREGDGLSEAVRAASAERFEAERQARFDAIIAARGAK